MIVERMKAIQHKLDPSRLCTAAMNGSWDEGFTYAVDVQGSNYYKIGDIDALYIENFRTCLVFFPRRPARLQRVVCTKQMSQRGFIRLMIVIIRDGAHVRRSGCVM